MEFELVTPPTVEPIGISDVEAHCQYGAGGMPSDQRSAVAGMITAARRIVERRLRRQLCTATWRLWMDGFPDVIEIKDKIPVASVTSITYADYEGVTKTLATTAYQTDYASQQGPCRIMPPYGDTWPGTRSDTFKAVCVTFTSGYGSSSAVPQTIKTAMLQLVANWIANREPVAFAQASPIPFGVEELLGAEDWGAYS